MTSKMRIVKRLQIMSNGDLNEIGKIAVGIKMNTMFIFLHIYSGVARKIYQYNSIFICWAQVTSILWWQECISLRICQCVVFFFHSNAFPGIPSFSNHDISFCILLSCVREDGLFTPMSSSSSSKNIWLFVHYYKQAYFLKS